MALDVGLIPIDSILPVAGIMLIRQKSFCDAPLHVWKIPGIAALSMRNRLTGDHIPARDASWTYRQDPLPR